MNPKVESPNGVGQEVLIDTLLVNFCWNLDSVWRVANPLLMVIYFQLSEFKMSDSFRSNFSWYGSAGLFRGGLTWGNMIEYNYGLHQVQ